MRYINKELLYFQSENIKFWIREWEKSRVISGKKPEYVRVEPVDSGRTPAASICVKFEISIYAWSPKVVP